MASVEAAAFAAPAARHGAHGIVAVAAIGGSHRLGTADRLTPAATHALGRPLHPRDPDGLDARGTLMERIGTWDRDRQFGWPLR